MIILKIKRPTYTEFICTNCKCHEKIPTKIVLQMDMTDPGDPSYPPCIIYLGFKVTPKKLYIMSLS